MASSDKEISQNRCGKELKHLTKDMLKDFFKLNFKEDFMLAIRLDEPVNECDYPQPEIVLRTWIRIVSVLLA